MTDVNKPIFKIKTIKQKVDYGKFIIEPLLQGYGHTMGNALRRCLLSSLPGGAVTSIKVEGVRHQFSTLPGMKEDIIEFILNVKQIKIAYKGDKEVKATLETMGPGEVKAGDINTSAEVKIINKDLKLASLADKKAKLQVNMWIKSGFGYFPAEEHERKTLGVIPIDAIFTPVVKVNYKVETTRVGRRTDFDKLILEIWTDGSIKPKTALEKGAMILTSFFKQIYKPVFKKEKEEKTDIKANELLNLTVEELSWPTRIANALRRGGYGTVKDLTEARKEEIVKVKNLGKKSVEIVMKKLVKKGVEIKK
jgi:DNA-directed RNA polymerase subunit alpha